MKVRATVCLLLAAWIATVAAAAGQAAGDAPLPPLPQLPPLRLSPERLQELQVLGLKPGQLEAAHSAVQLTMQNAVRGWVARLNGVLDTLIAAGGEEGQNEGKEPASKGRMMGGIGGSEPMVDTVRRALQEGIPSMGIPPLDPFFYSHVPVVFEIPEVLDVDGQLDNITFTGLSSFDGDIPDPEFTATPSVNVNVTFDIFETILELASKYRLDAHTADLDVWGTGNISVKIFSLHLDGQVRIKALLSVNVSPCYINLSARSTRVEITGLFGGGLLTQLIGEIFTDLLNENLDTITTFIAKTAENGICGYLSSLSVKDLMILATKILIMPIN